MFEVVFDLAASFEAVLGPSSDSGAILERIDVLLINFADRIFLNDTARGRVLKWLLRRLVLMSRRVLSFLLSAFESACRIQMRM